MQNNYPQSKSEEFLNAFSHILASAYFAYLAYESLHIVAILYGAIFSSMFFASFLYHAETPWKSSFRLLDQFFIYIVIGASGFLFLTRFLCFKSHFLLPFLLLHLFIIYLDGYSMFLKVLSFLFFILVMVLFRGIF